MIFKELIIIINTFKNCYCHYCHQCQSELPKKLPSQRKFEPNRLDEASSRPARLDEILDQVVFTPYGYEVVVRSTIGRHVVEQVFGGLGGVRRDIRGEKLLADTPLGYVGVFGHTDRLSGFLFVLKVDGRQIDCAKVLSIENAKASEHSELEKAREKILSNLRNYGELNPKISPRLD